MSEIPLDEEIKELLVTITPRQIRKGLRLSQNQFAETYWIPLPTIKKWEGIAFNTSPSIDKIRIPLADYVAHLIEEKIKLTTASSENTTK